MTVTFVATPRIGQIFMMKDILLITLGGITGGIIVAIISIPVINWLLYRRFK
jgi:hypothetical protein